MLQDIESSELAQTQGWKELWNRLRSKKASDEAVTLTPEQIAALRAETELRERGRSLF